MENYMRAFKITETGNFMTKLLSGGSFDSFLLEEASLGSFDSFLLEEASLSMQVTWLLDGKINRGFYSSEEWKDESNHPYPLISWSEVRGHFRELIRGKKAPASLSIVLQLRPDHCEKILDSHGFPQLRDSVGAMVLNIRYDGSEVTLVTGIALKNFTLDKNADRIWDETMEKFLLSREIGFETMV